jgi:hypothetical protein
MSVVLMDPTCETAFELLGNAYLLIDKPNDAKAIEYADRAIALNPHNSEALITKCCSGSCSDAPARLHTGAVAKSNGWINRSAMKVILRSARVENF